MKDRIKKLRKELNLTQNQFGEKIGVKGNTITNYETGLRTPTDTVINNICKTFNVNEHWLRDGTGEMFLEQTRNEQTDTFDGVIRILTALDASDWNVLLHIASTLVNNKQREGVTG